MQSNFLISVVVPMYNAERFIAKCLEHLIHQTYKNLEIIIVDDGSKDSSVAICNKYAANDKRIKIISQKNAGPSVALNTGMAAAHGEYIHFHDHDDFVNLDYFEIMAHAAERPGARAAHARYCEFMAQHGATEIMSTPEQPLEVQELRLFNKCISKRVIFQNKIRYYFLGINIGTRRIIRE